MKISKILVLKSLDILIHQGPGVLYAWFVYALFNSNRRAIVDSA